MGQSQRAQNAKPALSAKANPRNVDAALAALADPHRRSVVDLLRERPHRAGELADALGLPAPTMSRHLRTLKDCGLVEEAHPAFDARVRIYTLKSGAMKDLRLWLDETEKLWSDQLTSFKAHVERKRT